ncbi:hypothetical protein QBC46DRAFT_441143 [Diplogelasinospora grovesii]|uniref:Uncharacterized protein n=1 Tax=Diplogelasinospora grovesii TaxID=303347 RepID=A0AAN6S228_9PEZI|nr:hypothetical protein QBC46DRAFT_441143 [Diplogelasinospora grovesii]
MPDYGPTDWVTNPDARSQRFKSFLTNLKGDFPSYARRLNLIEDRIFLALSLNDSPEEYRLKAFKQLEKYPTIYSEVIDIITTTSLNREISDPNYFFPCVATDRYVAQLLDTAQACMFYAKRFAEGSDMVWKLCGKHVFCLKCWKGLATGEIGKGLPLPFNAVCKCSGFKGP